MARVEIRILAENEGQKIDYSIDSGEIVNWFKKPGDAVAKDEALLEFDVSKAVITIYSPVSGKLVDILMPEGNVMSTARWPENEIYLKRPVCVIETEEAETKPKIEDKSDSKISWEARQKAFELGVTDEEISDVFGTGLDGSILPKDIEKFAMGRVSGIEPKKQPTKEHAHQESKLIKQSSKRRAIARHMEEAWKKPTAEGNFKCKLAELILFKENYGKLFQEKLGVKFRIAFPVVAALIRVLQKEEFKKYNGVWVYEKNEAENIEIGKEKLYEYLNLGISFNTPSGLVVLVLHCADKLSLTELARAQETLTLKAKNNTYSLADASGETVLFNNVGGLTIAMPEKLKEKKDRFEFIAESGYSILTPNVSTEFNLGGIDVRGCASFQVCFDHRLLDGFDAARLAYEVYVEIFQVLDDLKNEIKV